MHRSLALILALGFTISPALHAQRSLNPLQWFTGDDEPSLHSTPTAQQEDIATAALTEARANYQAGQLRAAKRGLKQLLKSYPRSEAAAEELHL
mgnify:FL=1